MEEHLLHELLALIPNRLLSLLREEEMDQLQLDHCLQSDNVHRHERRREYVLENSTQRTGLLLSSSE